MSLHCCDRMDRAVDPRCADHPDPMDCNDTLIRYIPQDDAYGLMPQDRGWFAVIGFCPFCGAPRRNLRDRRFDLLEEMGFDAPWEGIPEAFRSDRWWKDRGI